jgi:methylmalonyl-CoA epimerase
VAPPTEKWLESGLIVAREDPAWTVTIDRFKQRNALTHEILDVLPGVLEAAEHAGAAALVVTGSAGCFGAGFDIESLSGTTTDERIDDLLERWWSAVDESPVLGIAAIEGPCIGASLDLALGLDLLVADDSAWFWLPATRYGLVYRPAVVRALLVTVGPQSTSLMLNAGGRLNASRALATGLVADVVESGTVLARAYELARSAREGAQDARTGTKRMLRALTKPSFDAEHWNAVVRAQSDSPERSAAVARAQRAAPSTGDVGAMFNQIREVSIVVRNLDQAVESFRAKLGLEPTSWNVDERPPIQSRSATFRIGESCLALMEPTSPDGPIARFLERRGEGLFSVALAVDDIDDASRRLESAGVDLVLDTPMLFSDFPAYDRTYAQARMNFTQPHSLHGVLFEIQQLDR